MAYLALRLMSIIITTPAFLASQLKVTPTRDSVSAITYYCVLADEAQDF